MAIDPNVRHRVVFAHRIEAALIAGEAKRGCPISHNMAFHHARHIADMLWPLFDDETKANVARTPAAVVVDPGELGA